MIFLRRAMMIGETQDACGHAFGRTRRVRRFQIKPGDADMFAVMKLARRKRKILKRAEKVFIAPAGSAGATIVFAHKFGNQRSGIGTSFSLLRFKLEAI